MFSHVQSEERSRATEKVTLTRGQLQAIFELISQVSGKSFSHSANISVKLMPFFFTAGIGFTDAKQAFRDSSPEPPAWIRSNPVAYVEPFDENKTRRNRRSTSESRDKRDEWSSNWDSGIDETVSSSRRSHRADDTPMGIGAGNRENPFLTSSLTQPLTSLSKYNSTSHSNLYNPSNDQVGLLFGSGNQRPPSTASNVGMSRNLSASTPSFRRFNRITGPNDQDLKRQEMMEYHAMLDEQIRESRLLKREEDEKRRAEEMKMDRKLGEQQERIRREFDDEQRKHRQRVEISERKSQAVANAIERSSASSRLSKSHPHHDPGSITSVDAILPPAAAVHNILFDSDMNESDKHVRRSPVGKQPTQPSFRAPDASILKNVWTQTDYELLFSWLKTLRDQKKEFDAVLDFLEPNRNESEPSVDQRASIKVPSAYPKSYFSIPANDKPLVRTSREMNKAQQAARAPRAKWGSQPATKLTLHTTTSVGGPESRATPKRNERVLDYGNSQKRYRINSSNSNKSSLISATDSNNSPVSRPRIRMPNARNRKTQG